MLNAYVIDLALYARRSTCTSKQFSEMLEVFPVMLESPPEMMEALYVFTRTSLVLFSEKIEKRVVCLDVCLSV